MEPVVFKHWSNRKWAVLASLHKVIIICTLCFSYNLLAQEMVTGRPDSSQVQIHIELEEVEALAGLPADLETVSLKPLVAITARDISSAPATALEDLLEYIPQVDIRHRGKHGTQADLTIQGGTFDQSMVLLNGINISDPQTGHFQMNLPVDLSALYQVEVITGSASRRFGTNAFSGALNLVTRPADSTFITSGFRYGQHNFYKAFFNANIGGQYVSTIASVSTSGSDGYRENTDFRNTHTYIHSSFKPGRFHAHLMLGLNHREFGANAFYTPAFKDQYEETTTGLTALKMVLHRPRSRLTMNTYLKINRDHFLLDRNDPSFYVNDHLTRVSGLDLNGQVSTIAGIIHSGLQFRREQINSTSLGEPLGPDHFIHYRDEIIFTNGHVRNQINWNINHSLEGKWVALSGGILVHLNSDLGLHPYFFPGFDIRLKLPGSVRLFSSLNHSMRLPTFTDLYYQGPNNAGNPDLLPEKATTFELGIYGKSTKMQVSINGFYRQGRELIDWIWLEDEKWHTLNLTRVDAAGGDVHLTYTGGNTTDRGSLLDKVNVSYTFTHLTKVSDDVISRYQLDNLRHKVMLATDLRLMPKFFMSIRMVYQDRNGSYLKYDAGTGQTKQAPYDPFLVLDMKLACSAGRITLFLEVTNLLDVTYNDIGNVIQPGRWIMAGIEIR
ncbi:MAG: TonB-dependent receptor [Bacteroidales bacterium]|nr:TonB-dependent receptor [Bacteroidales bacterium]